MDVIEYKLSSNNATLVSHAIWKVLDGLKQKVESGESESKVTELKYLLTLCESNNGLVSITACQALVALAESGILTVSSCLSNLTVRLGKAKHCGAISSAICRLLTLDLKTQSKLDCEYVCPFALNSPQHPLITVLIQKKDAWRDVLGHVQTMMNHCKAGLMERHMILLRPLFLYILCNPMLYESQSCRQQAWHLLIRSNGTTDLQIEVLQWLGVSNIERCINTNNRICELAEIAKANRDKALCSALVPLIMSMTLEFLRQNIDPCANLHTISTILIHCEINTGSVLICLLAEIISICPSIYLLDVVRLTSRIVDKTSCNRKIAHSLVASLLQWMAYPTILSSDALQVAKDLVNKMTDGKLKNSESDELYVEKSLHRLLLVKGNLQFYTELCICVESFTNEGILSWLERLSRAPSYVISNYKLIIGGIFLESNDPSIVQKTCDILVACSQKGARVLPLILYKLTNAWDITETRTLLFALPKLTSSKEDVPIVINILKTLLAAGKPLNYLAIELFVRTLSVESRCHQYLQAALVELSNSDDSWHSDVTCARAMRYICEKHSEHGAELIPLLSQTLNRCSNRTGSTASALALNGISALCVAGVCEISSTWRVLAPRMNEEERPIVIQALCEFFGDIPQIPSPQDATEYDKLVVQVVTKLWHYAINSTNTEIIESAFKALTSYKLTSMPLCVLPVDFRTHVQNFKTHDDVDEEKMGNLLAPISADYWIPLLKHVNRSSLTVVGDFFRHFIQEELHTFRTGIYRWSHGEPGNFKYLSEKSLLREIGEHIRGYKPTPDIEEQRITQECMRIFAHKYVKALPPIKWEQFNKAISISSETRKYGISLACHQAPISPSAKEYLETLLTSLTKSCSNIFVGVDELKECCDIYKKLDDVCRAVGSNVLSPFLEATLYKIIEKSCDDEDVITMLEGMMAGLGKALKDELIHDDNRSLLTSMFEKLMDRIDVGSQIFKCFTNATLELNVKELERMTLPSVWLDVSSEKLKKAIIIRAELVLQKKSAGGSPLIWMNEIIRASTSFPLVHSCLLEQMQRILPQIRLEKSNASWTLDLMRWIGSIVADSKDEGSIDKAIFLCEILFITVICLSGTDCLLFNERTLMSHDVRAHLFPQALADIVQTAHWKDIIVQTMEWLNHMRTASIPRMYKIVFHNALASLKNESYFEVMWMNYLTIRAPINA